MFSIQALIDQAMQKANAGSISNWLANLPKTFAGEPAEGPADIPRVTQAASYSAGEYVPEFDYTPPPAGFLDDPSAWLGQNGAGLSTLGQGIVKKAAKSKKDETPEAPQAVVLQPLRRITLGKGLL